ncbi:MAG: adenylate kinase [Lachnospiraceae bacterium]|nr:adenylate kinase [Lachnospiraceae bacterium]
MKIIMLGAPGAGKGTQAEMIVEKYRLPHISTGDIFRSNIKAGTELGKEAEKYISQGLLVPDELTVRILLDRVAGEDCKGGYILDGFPRTTGQAQELEKAQQGQTEAISHAINIHVPDEVIVARMGGRRVCPTCSASYHLVNIPPKKDGICDKCGSELIHREDDREETVSKRLQVYHEQTQPLIRFYEEKGILHTVDGTLSMQEVFHRITDILENN